MFIKIFFSRPFFRTHIHQVTSHCFSSRNCVADRQHSTWEGVIGLEIHAQINAKSKLFSNTTTFFNAPTNSQVTYFDAALPGCLPVLNKYCVEAGVLTALALNCKINKVSTFDRKHYFYPDLPAGYQITQQFKPLATDGHLKFHVNDRIQGNNSYECCAYLKQLQLEQDSGRSFHIEGQKSLVDLNRAGIGLMELVFEPNLKNGTEAAALVKELILILQCIGVCTCEMEEGALRVDANISVNHTGDPLGVRTEVKNINSVRYIARAIDFEIDRQIKVLESGGVVSNETRRYDYTAKKTIFMRDKETLQDYRFMPEPNLPPLILCDDSDKDASGGEDIINIDDLRRKLPPLPADQRKQLLSCGISQEEADRLLNDEGAKVIFEEVSPRVKDKSILVDFLFTDIQYQLNKRKLSFFKCPVTTQQIGDILELYEQKTISEVTSQDILEMLCNGDPRPASDIVKEYNWYQIFEGEELERLCREAMVARPKMVKKYRNSRKQKYMTSLLKGVNHIANNRVHIKDAEKTFIRLIFEGNEAVNTEDVKDLSEEESESPNK